MFKNIVMNNFSNYRKQIFQIVIIIIALISLCSKIQFGLDDDEQYAISMSYRLYSGEILLKDLWDPYQLSAIFMLPIFFLKDIISLLGIATPDIILLNRIVGVTIHIMVSFFVYIIFKKYISKKYSYIGLLTYLLILPKQTLIIDRSNLMNWFSTIMILLLFLYMKSNKLSFLVCSSVFLALTVLSYPTQAVLLLFINVFW